MTAPQTASTVTHALPSARMDTWPIERKRTAQRGAHSLKGKCRRCGWAVTLADGAWSHDYALQALVCAVGSETP